MPDRTLTLEDSINLALRNSPSLLTLREEEDIALQRVRESESLLFPKLDFNANWSKFRVEGDKPLLLQPDLGPTLITSSPRQNFYTARANIYQTVYQGGRGRNTWRQARISYERARSADDAARVQVTNAAKHAYYDLLFAQSKQGEYQAVLQRLKSLFQGPARASLGRLHLENELAILRTDAAQAGLAEEEARLAFLRALNLELSTTVSLKGELNTKPVDIDLQKMLAWASQYRSELRQTEYQEELDALGISLSLAERTPTIGFGATYERSGNDISLDNAADWAGTLNINLPLSVSDLIYGWAKVRERKAQYRQATLRHAETADQIQLQVREACTRVHFWQGELEPREREYERFKMMTEALRGRSAADEERALAERLLVEARVRYQEAVHGHLAALTSLEQAIGHSLNFEQGAVGVE